MNAQKLEAINSKLAHGKTLFTQENQMSTGHILMSMGTIISAWQKLTKESEMLFSFQNFLNLSQSLLELLIEQKLLLRHPLNMEMTMFQRQNSNI